ARQKLLGQILVASALGLRLLYVGFDPALTFPFFKKVVLNLGFLYIPFVVLVLVGVSNAVN
ncbi:MAG TPA: phospho-N-acetylmuramoyl-pentapeptide-transferase, partial [Acidobacteria bacterium]|nr:phospho-N-acetylmuramoyl-pentapeptide-transferase [Acidobacteriota bacterium]